MRVLDEAHQVEEDGGLMTGDGTRRRTFELPPKLLIPAARVGRALHLPVPLSPAEIADACHYWWYTPARAIAELGYRPRPVREAMEATVRSLRARGLRSTRSWRS